MRTKAHASSGCPMRESAYKAVIAQTVQNMVPEYSDQRKERSRIGNFFFVLFVLFILSNVFIGRHSRSDIREGATCRKLAGFLDFTRNIRDWGAYIRRRYGRAWRATCLG
jgi:hypothetical protein